MKLTIKNEIRLCLLGLATLLANHAVAREPDHGFEQFWNDAQKTNRVEKSEASQHRLDWWREARFGMFIHWDMSSVAASEISWSKQFYQDDGEHYKNNPRPSAELYHVHEHQFWLDWFKPAVPGEVYDNLYKSFYPGMFDADKIVAQAKAAGMKYIIEVSKHHNGFCMWDTKFTDYNIMHTPFHRDILGEMAKAAKRAGLKFGVYYSQRDWHHPDYGPERMAKYNEYMFNQIRELLTKYPNISVIFFDCEKYYPSAMWNGKELFRMIHQLRPDIIINDRCGMPSDYTTPEQVVGGFNLDRDWESCMTFTGFWSWHGFQAPVISFEECVRRLAACACGNGNLLMNIGPMPTGQIDPREADRLQRVGVWLRQNGESIYGTTGGPYKPGEWGGSTRKGKTIYVHIWKRLGDGRLELPNVPAKLVQAHLLNGAPVKVAQQESGLQISDLQFDDAGADTVVALLFDSDVMNVPAISVPAFASDHPRTTAKTYEK